MKQFFTLFLLVALCNGADLTAGNRKAMQKLFNFFKTTKAVSKEALRFLDNVFEEMARYRCDVGGKDCAALKVATEDIELAIDNASLRKANKLYGARFFEAGKELAGDFKLINGIRNAVIKYICAKEPKGCATLTSYETNIANALEKQIKH